MYLWREAIRQSGGVTRPRDIRVTPLAAAQMACIAALVLALASPVLTSGGGRTAIVVDLSASMAAREGQGSRLDAARTRVRDIVDAASRFATIRLILGTATPRVAGEWLATDPRLQTALDALTPTAGAADLASAIDLAAAPDAGSIVVFCDSDPPTRYKEAGSPPVRIVRVGAPADNLAVTQVAVRNTDLGGRNAEIVAGLRNYGTAAHDADVEIRVDDRPVEKVRVSLGPGRTHFVNVSTPERGRLITAKVLGGDALALDDERSIVVPISGTVRVAFVGPRDSFLERALAVNPTVSSRAHERDARLTEVLGTGDVDLIVCDACLDPAVADAASLVVGRPTTPQVRGALRVVSSAHPLVEGLETGDVAVTVNAGPWNLDKRDVVMRVGGAAAVLAADAADRRRVTIHLDLTAPDLVLSPAFPVLVANAVAWVTARRDVPSDIVAGEPLSFALPRAAANAIHVAGPDGRARDARVAGEQAVVTDTDSAGVYRVQIGKNERLVAVNPNVSVESDLSTPRPAQVDADGPAASALNASVPLARWLMVLALALLGLEWHLRMRSAW